MSTPRQCRYCENGETPLSTESGHLYHLNAEGRPDCGKCDCKNCGVAAPLEPSAHQFAHNWAMSHEGVERRLDWRIFELMKAYAAAVSKNLQEELAEINRVIMERFGELKCSTKDDEGNQLDASDLVCILATRLELSRQNFAKAESRLSALESEITALREKP